MVELEEVRQFLSREPLRYSYMLAQLSDDPDINIAGEDRIEAVILKSDNVLTLTGEKYYLLKLFKSIAPGEYRFHAVDPVAFGVIDECAEEIDDGPTWMFKRPIDHFGSSDIEVEPLVVEDADEINRFWGGGNRQAQEYIKMRIESAPAYGIRREGELIAWCLTHYLTDHVVCLGFLHVKERWRRKGFAHALTERLCHDALDMDLIPVVDIYKDNPASLSLAHSMGFKAIAENHWLTAKVL